MTLPQTSTKTKQNQQQNPFLSVRVSSPLAMTQYLTLTQAVTPGLECRAVLVSEKKKQFMFIILFINTKEGTQDFHTLGKHYLTLLKIPRRERGQGIMDWPWAWRLQAVLRN